MTAILPIFVTIWRSLDGRGHRSFFIAFFLFLGLVVIRLSTPFYFAYIVTRLQKGAFEPLVWLIGYAVLFAAVRILEELRFAAYVYFQQYFQKSLSLMLLRRFFLLSLDDVGEKASAETAIIVDRGLGGLRDVMYNIVFSIGPLLIETLVLMFVLARSVSVSVSLIVLALLTAFVVITYRFTSKISTLQQRWYRTASKNFKMLSESIKSQETVRSLEKPRWIERRYALATDTFIRQVLDSLPPGVAMGILQGILIGALMFAVTIAIVSEHETVVDAIPLLVLANGLIIQIITPLVQFAVAYRIFIQGISSAAQLVHLLTAPTTTLKQRHDTKEMGAALVIDRANVQFRDGKSIIFKDFHLTGLSCTVIVGRTGSGKSTLARVVAGLQTYSGELYLAPDSGRIYYMSQHVDVFDTTLERNVAIEEKPDLEKVRQSLFKAGFTEAEIEDLSDRDLGEGGKAISGGQRSRLGIARMLYHEVDIMIFDEPTASLDEQTARKVRATILGLRDRAAVMVVTHDRAFSDQADHVYEINDVCEIHPTATGGSNTAGSERVIDNRSDVGRGCALP